VRANEREVVVAVLVQLARAHHHVTPPRPHDVEHRSVGVPRADHLLGLLDSHRHDVLDEQCFAVRHHELGSEGRLGQSSTDHRQGADRVGEDLAVAEEALGQRDRANLGARRYARSHEARTAAW
jgi:hypothetical protein